ncbi:hypothetical protein EVAR_87997_1 [Eumeta japonica]|uniref:Uncharacterized protein n=1 Tax=Eumeta variegata TaxID=151549 RepID=A0A4C1VB90_EUMVA|nr:hypothetical protein EVAR_87997_1 [Eumeta japonica]
MAAPVGAGEGSCLSRKFNARARNFSPRALGRRGDDVTTTRTGFKSARLISRARSRPSAAAESVTTPVQGERGSWALNKTRDARWSRSTTGRTLTLSRRRLTCAAVVLLVFKTFAAVSAYARRPKCARSTNLDIPVASVPRRPRALFKSPSRRHTLRPAALSRPSSVAPPAARPQPLSENETSPRDSACTGPACLFCFTFVPEMRSRYGEETSPTAATANLKEQVGKTVVADEVDLALMFPKLKNNIVLRRERNRQFTQPPAAHAPRAANNGENRSVLAVASARAAHWHSALAARAPAALEPWPA